MAINVLAYLERSAERFPDKIAVTDEFGSVTYDALLCASRRMGTALARRIRPGEGVGVYMEKSAETLEVFFGAVYAGGFYSALNPELPAQRLGQIVSVLSPGVIVTSRELEAAAREIFPGYPIVTAGALAEEGEDPALLSQIHRGAVDTDPLYVNFTSGSTGVPKGIVVAHRSVLDFIGCFTELFGITSGDVIANQAPFDFDVSVKDIYSAMATGARLVLVPRRLFSAPAALTDFLCDNAVTTMIWAVSALCLLTTFHALDYRTPETVNKILFSGEVMPFKALKELRKHLPGAMLVNLYGPTEITCNCTYHILEEGRDYAGGIPIGCPFPNEDVFLLDGENRKVTAPDTPGEICVRGTALALGYYGNPEQNAAHFVQNPLNPHYPERIYRTGDLGRYNALGELVFAGRKDFQIKYMGHRIELEEIEREMARVPGVERCCCVFDEKRSRLRGFYVGSVEKDALHAAMKGRLPDYMIPGILRRVEEMPLTKNGKIDRKALAELTGGR
ncbi:MAG: amino acid adenylation domain-containing protein [Candidatus Faecousia sp.]|nr:amino acid adenylation domain-containing protein [Clostridiales bacterium]MDY6180804.1 amino acid adenylation domain-containing protein [Candidatus Faecousia sp.]